MEAQTETRHDLIELLQEERDLSPTDAEEAAEAVFGVIREQLLEGSQVVIPDFASLKVVEKKAHIVKDPDSGHQYISPAENVVSFVPIDSFQADIDSAKLSSIILAAESDDPFARVIEFHFSRVGWTVHLVNSRDEGLSMLGDSGAYLTIVDHSLENSEEFIREIKCTKETSSIPMIALYPSDRNPETSTGFQVLADEHLVEPFEVYTLLMLAESELARSSEEEIIFDQQVNFQFGTTEANLEKANDLGARLFEESGLDEEGQVALAAAFREAIGNAAQHGNKDNPDKLIKVLYLLDKEKITIVVTDEGPGFDHEQYTLRGSTKDAVSAARERHEQGRFGGLGIMLMQKCTDRLEYNDVGNMITLTKYLDSDSPSEIPQIPT